jgi:hypothetical protein
MIKNGLNEEGGNKSQTLFVLVKRLFKIYFLLFYPLCLPLKSGGGRAKKNFSIFE